MIDFHTHVLADFDDGPKDAAESRKIVEELKRQGVTTILSTSHFYPYEESPESFLSRRDAGFAQLLENCADIVGIELVKGAEVYCSHILDFMIDPGSLCIDKTQTILIELPNKGSFSESVIRITRNLSVKHGLTPVIAHVERYPEVSSFSAKKINKLKSAGCRIQVNCDSLLGGKYYNLVHKLIGKGLVDVIGSDCHDMSRRPPRMKQACEAIAREFGHGELDKMLSNAEELVRGKPAAGIFC